MYDDDGRVVVRNGVQEPRVGKVPCDSSIKCPKGHYSESPDLTAGQYQVLALWRCPQMLSDAEKNDDFLLGAFAALSEQEQVILDAKRSHEIALQIATGASANG